MYVQGVVFDLLLILAMADYIESLAGADYG